MGVQIIANDVLIKEIATINVIGEPWVKGVVHVKSYY